MSPVIDSPRHTYPARCRRATHTVDSLKRGQADGYVCVHGRLFNRTPDSAHLHGEGEEIPLCLPTSNHHHLPEARSGDIVEVSGRLAGGTLLVEQMALLVPAARATTVTPLEEEKLRSELHKPVKIRSEVVAAVRDFFVGNGFQEVETPTLARTPAHERHILPFQTEARGANQGERFLVASPEHHMKRLLARGLERIFQIGRCFRNDESTPLHLPEFTMVEWYRAYSSYRDIAEDTENLVAHVTRSIRGTSSVSIGDRKADVTPPWLRMTVDDAFRDYCDVDLSDCTSADKFRLGAVRAGWGRSIGADDDWEEVFFKLMLERVEPALAALGVPVFLTDYPVQLAAMAKLHVPADRLAERLEAYVVGIELGNGYTELNDPREQRRRFMSERQACRQTPAFPIDEAFMRSLAVGMPPSGGMALGLDRLVMLMSGATSVHEVVAFTS